MNSLSLLNRRGWNPFHEIDELNQLLFGDRRARTAGVGIEERAWSPLVDVVEGDNEYVIKAELPEVSKKDVSVKVEDGVLTISGERKAESVTDDKRFHRVERSYGTFVRTFRVPENAETGKVAAAFKDGVLRVTLPKVAEAKPKAIEIAVA